MFTSPITAFMYESFLSSYQSLKKSSSSQRNAYVYADKGGIRFIADLIDDDSFKEDSVFALSVAEDGWMELLALYE